MAFAPQQQQCAAVAPKQAKEEWNEFLISTLDKDFVKTARRGANWHHVQGDEFRSDTGEVHRCDQFCIRWVFRHDGLKICSVSGRCVNSLAPQSQQQQQQQQANGMLQSKTKRRCDDETGCSWNTSSVNVSSADDAIARMENDPMIFAPALKKRSFRSAASEATDQDMDMDDRFDFF
ncbi:Hypothetical Protein FCC1311_053272 [Hondaea fermentalgiana]|uniref:Uncharacterized protein n=1 Tax=Hondaea fermentalgiana TaxID=2315210 RepID=A0A2R5GML0_9STRA|nr:Hypothetical Protein FCC1311_053272 [Hondaea fermentalgiana]|eukprot:GBG29104.1 Hypothetical Protein FCC1311_053272 [Hondaea fermentalgiana]